MDIAELLAFSVKNKASDLHLSAGLPPMIRVHGDVRRINVDPLEHKQVHDMVYDIMNDSQRKNYEETLECDFSFEIQGLARFRVNAFNQNRGAGAVFRTIPSKILTLEQLNCPPVFAELDGLTAVLDGLARQGVVALLVDDVQWLDSPSADVLTFVARRPLDERLGFLIAKRGDCVSAFERALDAQIGDFKKVA